MIVITRNGKTQVYTGWRAWLLVAAITLIAWLFFALIVLIFFGIALTAGLMALLLLPAALVAAALSRLMR